MERVAAAQAFSCEVISLRSTETSRSPVIPTSQQGFIVTDSGGTLLTTGTGDIIIDGTGGNRGSQIQNNFVLSTVNGDIQITGDATDRGVFIDNAVVESTGTGNITLSGTGNNIGVSLQNSNGRVTSTDGSISVTGLGPGNDITTFSSPTINSTNGGNISLFADELAIGGPVSSTRCAVDRTADSVHHNRYRWRRRDVESGRK